MDKLIKLIYNQDKILKHSEKLGEIPSTRQIFSNTFKVAWPSTLEAFLVALVTLIDTVMVSGLGESAVAAVGLTSQPKFIGLSFFVANGIAVSAIVARRRGQNDQKGANDTLYNALGFAILGTVLISALTVIFADELVRFIGSNEDTHDMATGYLRIVMAGIIFQTITLTINAAQRGSGNTKIVMRCNLVSNGVNLLFNYLLIHGNLGFPALGVNGAALATVLGTVVAMVMTLHSAMPGKGFIYIKSLNFFKFDKRTVKSIFNVSTPTMAEHLFLRFGFLMTAMAVANLGTIAFAANQVAHSILVLSFAFADGLSIAAVALVGQSLGQKRPDLANLYGAMCQRIGFSISIMSATVFRVFGTDIFRLFSKREDILDYSVMLTAMMSVAVLLQVTQFIYSGCLRGAGDTRYTAMVSLISVAIVRPLTTYIFAYPMGFGLTGVWMGLLADQMTRMVFSTIRFKRARCANIKI